MYSITESSGEVEDFTQVEQLLLAARNYQRVDRGVNDKLDEVAYRGGFHISEQILQVGRFFSVLVPEIEEQFTFGGEGSAGHKKMLNGARDVLIRTEETVPLLIG